MRKTIVAMVAAIAVLVVGGGIGALAQAADGAESTTLPVERPVRGHLPGALLDEMVADGVITDEQASAIGEWLEARRAEMATRRAEHRTAWDEAWADGVLTGDEGARFPMLQRLMADSEAWSDGRLTQEEFEALRADFGPRQQHRHGADD
ncbi:MAG TPA: hypothetical protein VLB67_00120 [Acidimicrobiia bacterium]|nr:hypothetical protein [Acidimicrobiia bacterium]